MSRSSWIILCFVVGAIVVAALVPQFLKPRLSASQNACVNNLRQIDGAKLKWAADNTKGRNAVPTGDDLKPYLHQIPNCPSGGTYSINTIGVPPTCSRGGSHQLP